MASIDQLAAYIRANREKYSIDSLKAQLIKQGIPPADVDAAAAKAVTPSVKFETDPFFPSKDREQQKPPPSEPPERTTGGMKVIGGRGNPSVPGAPKPPASDKPDFRPDPDEPVPQELVMPESWNTVGIHFTSVAAAVIIGPRLLGLYTGNEGLLIHLAWGAGFGIVGGLAFNAVMKK